MKRRPFIKGERHHWWPQSVSQNWTNADGYIIRVDSNGNQAPSTPARFARISDGHNFNTGTPWDYTFEDLFDKVDDYFPHLVDWIRELVELHKTSGAKPLEFQPQSVDDDKLILAINCVISLVVRSPRFREDVVNIAQDIRGPVEKIERKPLAAVNLQQTYQRLTKLLRPVGKIVVVWSANREFNYGDGLYSNLSPYSQDLRNFRAAIPITPTIAVVYTLPSQYIREPRVHTLEADHNLIEIINESVQIFSKECLFYRNISPALGDFFRIGQYMQYSAGDPILDFISQVPGIHAV